jgi:enoyl-CoA hydratase
MHTLHESTHALATLADTGIGALQVIGTGKLNIAGTPVIAELRTALAQLAGRRDLRVLVLRGSGDDAFIGGADFGEMARLNPTTATSFITQLAGLCDAVAAMPVPPIARIAG